MQKNKFCESKKLHFKHFSRKGYALFACMGREVLICTLSAATLSHAKAEGVSIRTEIAEDTLQRKELKLDEVIVTGSRAPLTLSESAKIVAVITREDIHRAAAESINDILKLATGVDVRQRGGFGVQTDISVRGGNFDQITILLNGVDISSPHTGHLSADFPISPEDIERIEILEGPAARIYGTSAFNGVINIVTANNVGIEGKPVSAYMKAEGGSYGYANGNAGVQLSHGEQFTHNISGGYSRSDGATPNSNFTSTRMFYNGSYSTQNFSIAGQAGYSYKPYAANTFYGASSTDQWESNERIMVALNSEISIGALHLSPQLHWNRWYDHYQWHKDNPAGENFHKVDNYAGGINAWFTSCMGKTALGMEVKRDEIWSTKLGLPSDEWQASEGHDGKDDVMYKYHDGRTNTSLYLEHNILLPNWTFSLGLLANRNTGLDTKWRFYPGVDIAFRPDDKLKISASWNMALRMPTFTDLYYSGSNIEGNSNLKPEKTSDLMLGASLRLGGILADAQLFYSHKSDMIDWVTYKPATGDSDGIFHSVNFQMDNKGVEFNIQALPRELLSSKCPVRKVEVKYSYIYEDSNYDVNVIASKYAMDYLRHKVVVSADGNISKNLTLNVTWRWQDRTGEQNPSYALLDARLAWERGRYCFFADGTNILNKKYFDYISIPQPGRCFKCGVILRL